MVEVAMAVDDGNDPTLRTPAPHDRTTRYPAPDDRTAPAPPPAPAVPDDAPDDVVLMSYEAVPQPPYHVEAGGAPSGRAEAESGTGPIPLRAEVAGAAVAPDQGQDAEPDADALPAAPDTEPGGYPYPVPPAMAVPSMVPPPGPPGPSGPPGPPGAAVSGTSGPSRHRSQTLRFVGVLAGVVVLGLLAAAVFAGTLTWPFGGGDAKPTVATCTQTVTVQAASLTKVRVYNGSTRRGLALATARELQKRGFKLSEPPRNDPQESKPGGAAVIRHGAGGLTAARTVATQVKGKVVLEQDVRRGEDVDLVLGQTFELVGPAAGAAALKNRPAGSPSC
jgi:hypothetical protein